MTGVLIRGGKFGHRHAQGEHHVQMEIEVICHYLWLGDRKGQDYPLEPPEGINPADTLFHTSSIQRDERISFCCFKVIDFVVIHYGSPKKTIIS